ncbi:diguanylate cyclase [Pelomonas sp. SE-A7]|uniref:diguanylate cyclase n=1 Tax=Pelomonas sp. SE-A7 TaxID=3054953 RepID=UPI00259CD1FB|nr:diguanylate cyclase [Pelomonas sp. SE-A7]MDM4765853.1 diguanylate cyclase [Pelomonas sp. SE-A7]
MRFVRPPGISERWFRRLVVAFVVLAGVLATLSVTLHLRSLEQESAANDAQVDAGEIARGIQRRVNAHGEVLYGLAGLFNTGLSIDREAFRRYVERWQPRQRLPGFQAIQYVRAIRAGERQAFVAEQRADRSLPPELAARFDIRPPGDDEAYAIQYTEPIAGNEAALGLDLRSRPSHRSTMEHARDQARLLATERVALVQDPSGAPAFVMRLPVYRHGPVPADVAGRRAALQGFVAVVYRVGDLVEGLLDATVTERVRIVVHDAGLDDERSMDWLPAPANLMYDSDPAAGNPARALEEPRMIRRVVDVGGRSWFVYIVPRAKAYQGEMTAVVVAGGGGALVTMLTAVLAAAWLASRDNAKRLGRLTQEQQAVFDNALSGIVHVRGRLLHRCNEKFAAILGYKAHELADRPSEQLFESAAAQQRFMAEARERHQNEQALEFELALRAKTGALVCCSIHGRMLGNGDSRDSIWVIDDLTEQRANAARVAEQNLAIAHANAELQANLDRLLLQQRHVELLARMSNTLQVCQSAQEVAQVASTDCAELFEGLGGSLYLLDAESGQLSLARQWGGAAAGPTEVSAQDCWALRRSRPYWSAAGGLRCRHVGCDAPYACLPLTAMNELLGLLCLQAPAGVELPSEQGLASATAEQLALTLANVRMRERLRDQAVRDKLTGLFNRRYLDESLQRELARARRLKRALAVILIDVDHFKSFNDQHGHEFGDQVLAAVGRCMARQTRASDLACRYGGEEFVLLMPEADLSAAQQRAEALRVAMEALVLQGPGKGRLQVTASFGVAVFKGEDQGAAELLARADAALYRAKHEGRNRVCWDPA